MRTPCYSHIHIDIATERRSVGDGQAIRFHVTDEAPTRLNVHARVRADITRQLPRDADRERLDVGFDHSVGTDRHGLTRGERAFDGTIDQHGLFTRELAFDDESSSHYAACHITSSLSGISERPPSAEEGARVTSRLGSSRPKQVSSTSVASAGNPQE